MILEYTSNSIRARGVLSIKQYGDIYRIIWNNSVRKKGFEKCLSDSEHVLNPFDGCESKVVDEFTFEPTKRANNISRAKSKIFEYAYCNTWDFFVTLTISPDKYNRYDLQSYIKDLGKWISNYHTNHGSKIMYLLIPELHKDDAWHMHGLISGILPKHLVTNEYGHCDFPMYRNKFGFINMEKIKSHEGVSKYISKYVSKDLASAPFGQRLYYCSKGLKKAEVLYRFENIDSDCIVWDYEHPDGYCKISMVDNLDFMQDICIV